jgi:hypothetical protein
MLALPHGDNEENIIYSKFTLSDDYRKIIEPAGRPFEEYITRRLDSSKSFFDEFINPNSDKDLIIEEDEIEYEWEKEYKERQKNNDNMLFSNKDNYYAILGIEELFLNATVDDRR